MSYLCVLRGFQGVQVSQWPPGEQQLTCVVVSSCTAGKGVLRRLVEGLFNEENHLWILRDFKRESVTSR